MFPLVKKRKIDSENREFHLEWTNLFLFELDGFSKKPKCLLCSETIALIKSSNVKRHFETKHPRFNTTFPLGSVQRKDKINGLKQSHHNQVSILANFTSHQQKITKASFIVANILGKSMLPYFIAPVVK